MLVNTFACKIVSGMLFSAKICNPEINVTCVIIKVELY